MTLKRWLTAAVLCVQLGSWVDLSAHAAETAPSESADKIWVFCDLGNTLIDTDEPDHLTYLPGAREYLEWLRGEGFKLGLIVNLPDQWGADRLEKIATLKKHVNERWAGSEASFPWDWFDVILVPPDEAHRKPDPTLFEEAVSIAISRGGLETVYQGEDAREVEAANRIGMKGHLIGAKNHPVYWKKDRYL